MAPQGKLELFSVAGHAPSLVRDPIDSPGFVAKYSQHAEGFRTFFTDASNEGWCAHLKQDSVKGLWLGGGKGTT